MEFDTYYNAELLEGFENHVAVHTRGWRHANSANESYSLASATSGVRDLGDGAVHSCRVVYRPTLDPAALFAGAFRSSAHAAAFFENADFANGGLADWGTGVGQLEVDAY